MEIPGLTEFVPKEFKGVEVPHNFFEYPEWYKKLYYELPDGASFLEIGTWTGVSIYYFARLVSQGKKKIKLYTVDTFEGSEELQHVPMIKEGTLYDYVQYYLKPYKDIITIIKGNSQEESTYSQFEDESLDAIFIDGDHSRKGFAKDIRYWYPKVKKGGTVSGHDYIWGGNGVKPVIDGFSGFQAKQFWQGDVWYYTKK